jgi:hypothetical protein
LWDEQGKRDYGQAKRGRQEKDLPKLRGALEIELSRIEKGEQYGVEREARERDAEGDPETDTANIL